MMATRFIDALLAAMPTPHARLAALTVVARWSGSTIYLPSESKAMRRQRAAEHMLKSGGMADGDVVRVLRERFGVCYRTAWSDCKTAKKNFNRALP